MPKIAIQFVNDQNNQKSDVILFPEGIQLMYNTIVDCKDNGIISEWSKGGWIYPMRSNDRWTDVWFVDYPGREE